MKKMVSLVLMVVMALCMLQVVSMANPVTLANASMTYVGPNGTGYEYNVVVNATATGTDEISILMFGTLNNRAFVTGDTVNLAVGELEAQPYYVYYVDQATAENNEASFDFNVVLPASASDTRYYIWAGSTTMDLGQMDKADFAASGVAFAVASVEADQETSTFEPGAQLQFNIALNDVFGDDATEDANADVDVLYSSDNGTTWNNLVGGYSNGAFTGTAPAAGSYKMKARVTRVKADETVEYADSALIDVTIAAPGPVASGIKGDADNDSYITTYDAVVVLTVAAGGSASLIPFTAQADVAAPAGVDGADAVAILKHAARINFISQD